MSGTKSGTLERLNAAGDALAETPEVGSLVERAQGGDPDAFEGLMRLYERRVIALGMHMGLSKDDALDACQDTFIKVFRYLHRFRTGEVFFRWLHRIALNIIFDHLRDRRTRQAPLADLDASAREALRSTAPSPVEEIQAATMARRLHESLGCLSRRERIVFVLRDLHQIPTRRIGSILGISPVTIRRHCMTARQKMRARLLGRPQ